VTASTGAKTDHQELLLQAYAACRPTKTEIAAAIVGPRTMEHLKSQLVAGDVELSARRLDRIDEINPPGVTINPADNGWTQPALEPAQRRR
jgi:aryl-alcohol dehydrogenase-like predicted oxidoreductase